MTVSICGATRSAESLKREAHAAQHSHCVGLEATREASFQGMHAKHLLVHILCRMTFADAAVLVVIAEGMETFNSRLCDRAAS